MKRGSAFDDGPSNRGRQMRYRWILIGLLAATVIVGTFESSGRASAIPPWNDPLCVLRTYESPSLADSSPTYESIPGSEVLNDADGPSSPPPEGVVSPPPASVPSPPPQTWEGVPGIKIYIIDDHTYYT